MISKIIKTLFKPIDLISFAIDLENLAYRKNIQTLEKQCELLQEEVDKIKDEKLDILL